MKLLLDTHIMFWWALGDARLSKNARAMIEDERNQCMVSTASLWEVAIKSAAGRGLPRGVTAARFAALIEEAGFSILDVCQTHAIGVESLGPIHGDPFDRMLVAQAHTDSLMLMTHDNLLAAYGNCVLLV